MKSLLKNKVDYDKLGGKEQENYNFAKTASKLAEYGFSCSQITADKHGADMLAYHIETGETFAIQLKGSRATLGKKYIGKRIWIAYMDRNTNELCLYNHDDAVAIFEQGPSALTKSWQEEGGYSGVNLHNQFNHIIIRLPFGA